MISGSDNENVLNNVLNIQDCKDLYTEMESKVKNYEKLKNLSLKGYIDTIKTYTSYPILTDKDTIDNKDKKSNLELIKKVFIELFDDSVEVLNIESSGRDNIYRYDYTFKYWNQIFELEVPVIDNLNEHNIESCHYGMIALYLNKDSTLTLWGESYFENSFKELIDDRLQSIISIR